jgi:hypothetical protein
LFLVRDVQVPLFWHGFDKQGFNSHLSPK